MVDPFWAEAGKAREAGHLAIARAVRCEFDLAHEAYREFVVFFFL